MSQQDNFSGGFFLGAVLGGIAGGLVGAVLASRSGEPDEDLGDDLNGRTNPTPAKTSRRPLRLESAPQKNMELARQSLEDKIASLNSAIDEVRQQLHQVNTEEVRSDGLGRSDFGLGGDDRSAVRPTGGSPSGETS